LNVGQALVSKIIYGTQCERQGPALGGVSSANHHADPGAGDCILGDHALTGCCGPRLNAPPCGGDFVEVMLDAGKSVEFGP
jgi:hypothetical protein